MEFVIFALGVTLMQENVTEGCDACDYVATCAFHRSQLSTNIDAQRCYKQDQHCTTT